MWPACLSAGWQPIQISGHSPDLRSFLEEHGFSYALAVPSTEVVCVQTRSGLLLSDVASIAQQAFRMREWQRLSQSQGTKGERLFDWARLPLVQAGTTDGRHWLVVGRRLDDPHELAYFLVWAPSDTLLPTMVQAIGARWHIEEDLQAGKALGLDHSEVRSYVGWYRHITLVLLAAAFLLGITVQSHLTESAPPAEPPAGAPLIPLTPSEARHEAFPPDLSGSHFGPSRLSVVDFSAHPSVLGRLLSSSPSPESRVSLFHYNRTFKAEQNKSLKEKKASRSSSPLCDILEG